MNEPTEKITPVVKSVQVDLPPEAAFRLFTEGIASWWPLRSHSVGEEKAVSCTLEGQIGGRIYETMKDGRQEEWGEVTIWEPPARVDFHLAPRRRSGPGYPGRSKLSSGRDGHAGRSHSPQLGGSGRPCQSRPPEL